MHDFRCQVCSQQLTFENSVCLSCGSGLGYERSTRLLRPLDADGAVQGSSGTRLVPCANLSLARCNWLVEADEPSRLCFSCRLTRTRPADTDTDGIELFADAEAAKRRLVAELDALQLPITPRWVQPETGLTFDLLSSSTGDVVTGQANGVITLDLAESDDSHRESLRLSMDEPYRTLLGHFRHEVGHYYFFALVDGSPSRQEFATLFGDPDADYQAALDRHYSEGAPAGWEETYISAYATMHAAEDWAETFAHYLHIRATLDTAAAFGLAPAGMTLSAQPVPDLPLIIETWLPLTWALNQINRSMGHQDLYPFVIPQPAVEKLAFAHRIITSNG